MENCCVTKVKTVKCPECLNKMKVNYHKDGYSGQCPVCKSVICSKQHTPKEKIIRIIKQ